MNIDCFVITACPRIALDDYLVYGKPVLNPEELKIALLEKTLKNFELNELI